MKLRSLSYLFPFVEDRFIQILMVIAALLTGAFGFIIWGYWDNFNNNPDFWDQYPLLGHILDGLVLSFVLTMAVFCWRYFKCYYDEFEAKKSEQMGFWAISILIGGSYLYSMLEYRFDLPAQPGWVWAVVINGIVFLCWIYSHLKYRS